MSFDTPRGSTTHSGYSTPSPSLRQNPFDPPFSTNPPSPNPSEKATGTLLPYLESQSPLESRFETSPTPPRNSKRKVWIWVIVVLMILAVVGAAVGAAVGVLAKKKKNAQVLGSLSGASFTPSLGAGLDSSTLESSSAQSQGVSSSSLASSSSQSGSRSGSGSSRSTSSGTSTTLTSSVAAVATANAQVARRMVVFGASYCDNGHARPSKYQSSLKSAPYYKGRESNGIVWDEYLAQLIAPSGTTTDLRNYAYSGAMVDNSIASASVPDAKAQIASYLADIQSGLVPHMGSGRTLVAVWIGLNPVISAWTDASSLSKSATASALSTITNTANDLVSQLVALRATLAANSSRTDFLVLPLPPTELLPYATYTSNGNAASMAFVKQLTIAYNSALIAGLAGLTNTDGSAVLTLDMTSLYHGVVSNPALIGATDFTTACVLGNVACSNPGSHLWWDSIHMTTKFHQYVAQQLYAVVSPTSVWT